MATSTVIPKLTLCPPRPAHSVEAPARVWGGTKHLPVHADLDGDGEWLSPGLSFEDYARCSTQTRKQSGERRLPTPEWANDWNKLRALVVRAWEVRAGWTKHPRPGTEKERLAVAQAYLMKQRPANIAALERLCHEFVETTDPDRRKRLQSLIKSLDSQIVINDRGPGVLAAMVHQYYGFCADSVGTANELGGIMPHTVRQHLYRLHRIWVRMQAGEEVREPVFMRTRCCACGSDVFTTHACDECASIRHYRRGRERKAASSNQKNTSSPASDRRDARWTEELMKAIDERWPTGR